MRNTLLSTLATLIGSDEVDNLPNKGDDGFGVFTGGVDLIYYAAGAIAVIVIIVGGIMYITSVGDQNSIERAKNTIFYAVIGLVVVIVAFVITQFIIGRF